MEKKQIVTMKERVYEKGWMRTVEKNACCKIYSCRKFHIKKCDIQVRLDRRVNIFLSMRSVRRLNGERTEHKK